MKNEKRLTTLLLVFVSVLLAGACSSDDDNINNPPPPEEPTGSCYVWLFDGDNFSDDNIVIDQEGEYSDLSNLPNSQGKDWNDEADSFKVGDSTTVTVWTQPNFQGDSTVYDAGEYASVDEPVSLKITCYEGDNDGGGDDNGGDNPGDSENCYVLLFDGDQFTDDSLTVDGPAEYSDLSDLPNAGGKDWTDEADSFKVSENATVTVWTETDFQGDSIVYQAGDYPSVDEPYSLKITCE